jgi:hypothetical protein
MRISLSESHQTIGAKYTKWVTGAPFADILADLGTRAEQRTQAFSARWRRV